MGAIVNRSSSSRQAVAPRRRATRGAAPSTPAQAALERLTRLETGGAPVVSCYLKLEPRDRARNKYLIKLKNRIKATEGALGRLGLPREQRDGVQADLRRIEEHLRAPGNLPSTQGVAVFASGAADLFEVVPLPVVHRSRIAVDATPLVRELAAVEDEVGRIIAVVMDRASARFFEVTAFETRELPGLASPSSAHGRFNAEGKSIGWGEHTYHNRIREEKQRHLESVARRLFEIDRKSPAHGFVIAAAGSDAAAIEPFLHSYVVERMLGVAKLSPKTATVAEVQAAVLDVREAWERASERLLVEECAEGLGSGWAVNGTREVLAALARGQVRALLVNADAMAEGVRAADSGRLALTPRDLRGEGEPVPVIDVIDEAIEDALRQHLDVNVVFDPEAAGRIDGLAALLRFR